MNMDTNEFGTLPVEAWQRDDDVLHVFNGGGDLDATDERGNSSLWWACYVGQTDIARQLLGAGANPNVSNQDGDTPLFTACLYKRRDIVLHLLKAGADANAINESGYTALWWACYVGQTDIARQLLVAGADPNIPNQDGDTPLITACLYERQDIVPYLLQAGANVNAKNNRGDSALWSACQTEQFDIARQLLEAGADVDIRDQGGATPLITACLNDRRDIVTYLLKAGADVNAINKCGNSALYFAGDAVTAQQLLEAGADVNIPNQDGDTPLISACLNDRRDVVSCLLRAGANVNAKNNCGNSSLWWACYVGQTDIARQLLGAGADPNVSNQDGDTPLIAACLVKQWGVVPYLLKAGAHVNAKNNRGNSSLLLACKARQTNIARLLLEAGADRNMTDEYGNSAFTLASQIGLNEIVQYFINSPLAATQENLSLNDENKNSEDATDEYTSIVTRELQPAVSSIPIEHLKNITSLNKVSNYSTLYRAVYCGTDIALKVLHQNARSEETELNLLSQLRHERVLTLMGVVYIPNPLGGNPNLGLVTQFMHRGSLYDVLHDDGTPEKHRLSTLPRQLRVLKDVAEGMRFLHDRGVIHRDLKSPNVLLDRDGRAKICDFGLSRSMTADVSYVTKTMGTYQWASPEALHSDTSVLRKSTDVYSYGVIMWEVITGRIPWKNKPATAVWEGMIKEGFPLPSASEQCPQRLAELMKACLSIIPDDRPTFDYILVELEDMCETCVEYPAECYCPISLCAMADPVICRDGHTYDREAIEKWLQNHNTSPLTNEKLEDKSLVTNWIVKGMIDEIKKKYKVIR